VSAARSPAALEGEVRTRAALVPARFSAGVSAPSRRLPARVALRGLTPASLTPGARPRPAFAAPAPAAPGFVFAFAAPRALEMAAVLGAFPLEAPDLPALAACGLGGAFRAALRLAPAALPLAVAVPGAGARRAVRGAAELEAVLPAAPAVRARVAAAGLAAAFDAPARPLPAVPWPPVLVAAVAAAPRRFGATLALLLPFSGALAVRALPAGGFAAALPRAGAPAGALAPLPAPGAARLAGLFLSSVGVFAIGSPRLVADVAPHHSRPLPERGQACGGSVQDRVARISWIRPRWS
jgi:hypothetical protein